MGLRTIGIALAMTMVAVQPAFSWGFSAQRTNWYLQNEKTGQRYPGGGSKDGDLGCEASFTRSTAARLWVDGSVRSQVSYVDLKLEVGRSDAEDLREYGKTFPLQVPPVQFLAKHIREERDLNPAIVGKAGNAEWITVSGYVHTKKLGVWRMQQVLRPEVRPGDRDWVGGTGYPADFYVVNRCFGRNRSVGGWGL